MEVDKTDLWSGSLTLVSLEAYSDMSTVANRLIPVVELFQMLKRQLRVRISPWQNLPERTRILALIPHGHMDSDNFRPRVSNAWESSSK